MLRSLLLSTLVLVIALIGSLDTYAAAGTQKRTSRNKSQKKERTSAKKDLTTRIVAKDDEKEEDAEEEPELVASHKQVAVVDVNQGFDSPSPLHSFCIDKVGNIYAAVGGNPPRSARIRKKRDPQVRKFDPDGTLIDSWDVPFTPQAITMSPVGYLFIAGDGKIAKLTTDGDVVKVAEAPHATDRDAMFEKTRKLLTDRNKVTKRSFERSIKRFEKMIADLEEKKADDEEEFTKKDEMTLKRTKSQIKSLEKALDRLGEPTDAMINQQIDYLTAVSSIGVNDKNVFLTARAQNGSGFAVWRSDLEFDNSEQVVDGLRGCCGQMDVQAREDGIYVAENARHRVAHYDANGKLVKAWGKKARTGIKDFGGCCNPMNVCFSQSNGVLTAESGTGRIKQFDSEGKLVGYLGDAKITGGCKNVSISSTADLSKVYMLDLTGSKICILEPKGLEEEGDSTSSSTASDDSGE